MTEIRLIHSVDVPIYKQIVTQLRLMIEGGQLVDGDKLPSSRLLADNLRINRNTVAKAYAELRDAGLVESKRRNGMVVRDSTHIRQRSMTHETADGIMSKAVGECLALGLSADQVSALAMHWATRVESNRLRVAFVECNAERAESLAGQLSDRLRVAVTPLVLDEFDPTTVEFDLTLTTFFHLAEVRKVLRGRAREVVPIVVAPHVQTLVELAGIGRDKAVGVRYATEEQAEGIRDALVQSGFAGNIAVLNGTTDADLDGIDVVVIPSEMPELLAELGDRVEVITFGNVLDESSTRMVATIIDDLRDAPVTV